MTSIQRPAAAAGAAVLLALSLTACGSSYPTDAPKSDFCDSFAKAALTSFDIEGEEPTEDEWENIQKAYEDLGEVGTPDNISDDNREGFEVAVDTITDLSYDDAKESFGDEGDDNLPGVSKEESDKAEQFFDWAGGECEAEISEQVGS